MWTLSYLNIFLAWLCNECMDMHTFLFSDVNASYFWNTGSTFDWWTIVIFIPLFHKAKLLRIRDIWHFLKSASITPTCFMALDERTCTNNKSCVVFVRVRSVLRLPNNVAVIEQILPSEINRDPTSYFKRSSLK